MLFSTPIPQSTAYQVARRSNSAASLSDLAEVIRAEQAKVMSAFSSAVLESVHLLTPRPSVPPAAWIAAGNDRVPRDRATVVTTALLQIIRTAAPQELRQTIEGQPAG